MKSLAPFAAAWVFVAALGLAPRPAIGDDTAAFRGKRAFLLHSYYRGYKWDDDEHRGIISVLEPAIGTGGIYVEYMDTKRFFSDQYVAQLPEVYRRKYAALRFDVVLVTDNNAFDFMREHGESLFPGVPVVFCGVNYVKEAELAGHPLFTGVSEEADLKASLDAALRLHPNTRRVFALNDDTETGLAVAGRLELLAPSYPKLEFTKLSGLAMPEILTKLRALPGDSIVFYTFFSRDAAGHFFEFDRSMELVAAASTAPVYGAWDFNLGYGLVGGMLTSGVAQGEAAARIALRVLRGESPAKIPVERKTPNRLLFDFNAMTRFGIPLSALPPGSEVINLPESSYSRYRTTVLVGAGALVFLVTVNAVLFANISRRKRAEEELRLHQEKLEGLVRKRSAQLETANDELKSDIVVRERAEEALRTSQELLNKTFASLLDALLIVKAETRAIRDCNPATRQLFGYERDEVIGRSTRLLHATDSSFDDFQARAIAAFEAHGVLHLPAFPMRRKDGEVFVAELAVMPLRGEDGAVTAWVSVIRDITEQKRLEERLERSRQKLRALAAELTRVEERERRAIAAHLHDQIGAVLAMTKVKLAALRQLAADGPIAAGLEEVRDLVGEAVRDTRNLTWELSPPVLYQLGLGAALEWLGEETEKRHGLPVRVSQTGERQDLGDERRFFLFSAVRELVLNVVKHARARSASIAVKWAEAEVSAEVRDDGQGFDVSDAEGLRDARRSFGLFNIQERASDLGGRVDVVSSPGRGTSVTVVLPFAESEAS